MQAAVVAADPPSDSVREQSEMTSAYAVAYARRVARGEKKAKPGDFDWNPATYHVVIRGIATLPPLAIAQGARRMGALNGLGGLTCPSPPWTRIERTGSRGLPVCQSSKWKWLHISG
jgi:hypothetical protein